MYSMELPISVDREHFRALDADKKFKHPKHPHTFFRDIDPLLVWNELELLVDAGLAKSIGLCNFNREQVQHILDNSRIKPANLEIEIHPYLPQSDLVSFCLEHDVAVTAFAPFGSSNHSGEDAAVPLLLEEPILKRIGDKYGKSPAQVVLHWLVQQNISVLPRAEKLSDLREDFEIFDFNLDDGDLLDIAQLGMKNVRYHSLD
ncbi:hypothetical protein RvY_07104-2 [Ramazzottius varieornatus]|uniref:NADP-dependent oxidoreductase domain-containing protein n=1 Tax=Ramazzottius varieornatus TaxID=947166 RepID=A0A1D1V0V6_RAMVA|nr:hypothetical protein RvY_07104-2 [Ramazzottius varieornatus]